MRLREAHIPILLWVCAAAVLHFATGEQAERMVTLRESELKLRTAAREVADPDPGPTILDFTLGTADNPSPPPPTEPPKPEQPADPEQAKKDEPTPEDKAKLDEEKKKKLVDKKKDEPKPEPPKKEPLPEVVAKAPPPPPQDDKKTSVQQHNDKDEAPNPDAKLQADKSHHVKPGEETQATITSVVENAKDPNPGTHQGPPDKKPGDSDKDKIAHDADRPGADVAPNVVPTGAAPVPVQKPPPDPTKVGKPQGDGKKLDPDADGKGPKQTGGKPTVAAQDGKGSKAPAPGSPDLLKGPDGSFTAPPATAGSAVAATPKPTPPGTGDGKAKVLPQLGKPGGPKWVGGLGFGAKGDSGKPSIAIDEKVLQAAVGMDELDKLKKVEAATKLSQHKGSWKSGDLAHWKSAIENYVPWVKPGNQTNLGTAAAPFATYLAKIHLRIHPIFGDQFIESLSDFPSSHPLNDMKLVTHMEIVLKPDGTIHHLGIVKLSGVTMFDVAALDAVERAGPFGKAPDEIISPDGYVYLHWEFHRDDQRCSTTNARPYKLKENSTPKEKEEPKEPPKLPPPEEKKLGQKAPTSG